MTASLVRLLLLATALAGLAAQPAHAQTTTRAAITRFEFDGALDVTFNSDGHVVTNVPSSTIEGFYCGAPTTLNSTNDRIVAGGFRTSSGGVQQLLLARYVTSRGALDTAFGASGFVSLDVTGFGNKSINELVIDSSRRIVIVGQMVHTATGRNVVIVARFTPAGALDTTFAAPTGRLTFNFNGTSSDIGHAVTLDGSGKIVVAGGTTTSGVERTLLARLTTAGAFDATFGTTGRIRTDMPGTTGSVAWDVAIDNDGKPVVAGTASTTALSQRGFIARYTSAGVLDGGAAGFNSNGVRLLSFPGHTGPSSMMDVAVDLINNYTVTGRSQSPTTGEEVAVARILPSGAYDGTFGNSGRVTTDLGGVPLGGAVSLGRRVLFPLNVLAPPMVVVGYTQNWPFDNATVFAIAYNADGTLFEGFSGDGIATTRAPEMPLLHGGFDAFVTTLNGRVTIFGSGKP